MPIDAAGASELIGAELFEQVKDLSIRLYEMGREKAAGTGILLADTKFEFGTDENGTLHLIDEVLTPDSSRYWPAESYQAGGAQPSYDKQFVRDYLETLAWDKQAPAPNLPDAVLAETLGRYVEAYRKIISA